jgi:hypothetical protein
VRLHELLLLSASRTAETPRLAVAGAANLDLLRRWRASLGIRVAPQRLRVARVVFDFDRGWHLVGAERHIDLEPGRPVRARFETASTFAARSAAALLLPGVPLPDRVEPSSELEFLLETEGPGVVVSDPHSEPGWRANVSGFAHRVFVPDLLAWHRPVEHEARRHEFLLAVLESRDAPARAWALDDWRAHLSDDLRSLSDIAERVLTEQRWTDLGHHFIALHPLFAASRLSIPAAMDSLRRLEPAIHAATARHHLAHARILAGDEDALSAWELSFVPRDDLEAQFQQSHNAQAWIRALSASSSASVRAAAVRSIEALAAHEYDAETAGDLLDAVRAGKFVPTPALRKRLDDGPTEDRSFVGQARAMGESTVPAFALELAMLVALVFALRPRRRPGAGLVATAWVVTLGVAFAMYDVVIAGVDLPVWLGLGLAAIGVFRLASKTGRLASDVSGKAFAVAAVLTLIDGFTSSAASVLVAASVGVGIAFLPSLAFRLQGATARSAPVHSRQEPLGWISKLPLALAVFFAAAIASVSLDSAAPLAVTVGTAIGAVVVLMFVRWARTGFALTPVARPWPRAIVFGYVLPVAWLLVARVVIEFGGPRLAPTIATGPSFRLISLPGVVVSSICAHAVFALLWLIAAARIRATWERMKPQWLREGVASTN